MHSAVRKLTDKGVSYQLGSILEIICVLRKGFKLDLTLIVLFRLKMHSFSLGKEHKFHSQL